MTEIAFYRRIIFQEYPGAIFVIVLNELLGTVLLLLGIGTIVPLLAELLGGSISLTGPIGEFLERLGVSGWPVGETLLFLAGLAFVQILLDMLRLYIAGSIGVHLNLSIKKKMNDAMLNADWEKFSSIDQGKYMQCMIAESSLARGAVNDMAGVLAFGLVTALLLIWLAANSFLTFVVFCLFGVAFMLSSRSLMRLLGEVSQQRIRKMAHMNTMVTDIRHVYKFLLAEDLLKVLGKKINGIIDSVARVERRQLFLGLLAKNYVSFIGLLAIVSVSILRLVFLKNSGAVLLFDLIILQRVSSYFSSFQVKRQSMLQKIPSYGACLAMIEVAGVPKSKDRGKQVEAKLEKGLSLKNISFSYKNGPLVLKDININLPPKGIVYFIGSSGSGKTTMVDLILGLLSVTKESSILLDGQDIRQVDKAALARLFAYVPQEAYILSGTLREYLTLGENEVNNTTVWSALELSRADNIVQSLPDGLDTTIKSGGISFSGGERHRLAIARALIRDAKILVLDEPSSALDKDSEQAIFNTLQRLADDILVIVVTHSRDVIHGMQNLFLFDAGEVTWQGNYEQLLVWEQVEKGEVNCLAQGKSVEQ